jgi:hypothetical protein
LIVLFQPARVVMMHRVDQPLIIRVTVPLLAAPLLSHSLLSHSLSPMPADLAVVIAVEFDVTLTVALVVAALAALLTFALSVAIAFADAVVIVASAVALTAYSAVVFAPDCRTRCLHRLLCCVHRCSLLILLVGCGDARIPLFVDNQSSLLRLILIGLGGS